MDPILGSSSIWVTPQARDLLQGSLIKCYVPGCMSTFKNSGNLQMHLDKHHKITPGSRKEPLCPKLYFCPQPDCVYNAKSTTKKHFKSLKYLRQHFQKVHAEKIYKCSKCSKSFGTAAMRDFHVRNCGKDFSCNVCEWTYDSSEALLTHAKRKGHKINKKSNENSGKVAIPKLRNKSLATIVLEVTNCIGTDGNADETVDMDPADYAHVLDIPEVSETTEEVAAADKEVVSTLQETETEKTPESPSPVKSPKSNKDPDTKKLPSGLETPPHSSETEPTRSLETPPPCAGDGDTDELKTPLPKPVKPAKVTRCLGTPPLRPKPGDTPRVPRVKARPPPPPKETIKYSQPLPSSSHRRDSSPVHHADPVDITGFSEGLGTPPHCPQPVDSTGYSECLKTPPHHPASLDSTIYCPGLTTPLHRPESVDPTSYSRCLETPRHCPDSDDESNYSRDLETPPCIEAEDSAHFAPVSPASPTPGIEPESTSKYSGGLETPPHCPEVVDPITFARPVRTPLCPVAVKPPNCIETQTESDPVCIALPPKKRLKVATTPPPALNHFTEPPFCDIETQTEFDIRSGPGDPMLYTDMHTQTCHEFLTELGLSNIQTQTNWSTNDMDDDNQLGGGGNHKRFSSGAYDELMVSTETQTSSTQCLLESCNEEDSLSGCITQHTQTCDFLLEGLFGGGNNDLIGGFQSSLRLDCFRPENNDR